MAAGEPILTSDLDWAAGERIHRHSARNGGALIPKGTCARPWRTYPYCPVGPTMQRNQKNPGGARAHTHTHTHTRTCQATAAVSSREKGLSFYSRLFCCPGPVDLHAIQDNKSPAAPKRCVQEAQAQGGTSRSER